MPEAGTSPLRLALVSPRSLDFPVSPGRLFFALSGDGFRQVSGGFSHAINGFALAVGFYFRCRCPRRWTI